MSRILKAIERVAVLAPAPLAKAVVDGWGGADAGEQAAYLGSLARSLGEACERDPARLDRQPFPFEHRKRDQS